MSVIEHGVTAHIGWVCPYFCPAQSSDETVTATMYGPEGDVHVMEVEYNDDPDWGQRWAAVRLEPFWYEGDYRVVFTGPEGDRQVLVVHVLPHLPTYNKDEIRRLTQLPPVRDDTGQVVSTSAEQTALAMALFGPKDGDQ